jgi:molecular chaperone Hsp33
VREEGSVTRFLFEGLPIRGAVVRLDACWQRLQQGRDYGSVESGLLGEIAAAAVLIAAQLKQPGRLTLQLRGAGPVSLLVVDCDEQLRLRGMARAQPGLQAAPVPVLLGAETGGQLMLSLDFPDARQPYQSFVPLVGDAIAAIFEHYLEQSEQQAARLFTAADMDAACCLFLQKLPEAEAGVDVDMKETLKNPVRPSAHSEHRRRTLVEGHFLPKQGSQPPPPERLGVVQRNLHDPDAWARVGHCAATVKPEELLRLDAATLLSRLFHEEVENGQGIRLFAPRPVTHHCPEDRAKVAAMLCALGREEAEAALQQHGEIRVRDDLCNREYCFDAQDVAELFTDEPGQ